MIQSDEFFQGLNMFQGKNQIESELGILKSYSLVEKTIKQMSFEVTYSSEKTIIPNPFADNDILKIKKEIYPNRPFEIILDVNHIQPAFLDINIKINNDTTFHVIASDTRIPAYSYVDEAYPMMIDSITINQKVANNGWVSGPNYKFQIRYTQGFPMRLAAGRTICCNFYSYDHLTNVHLGNLSVNTITKTSSVVRITLKGENKKKITNFLNQYTQVYLNQNLERKNRISVNTVKFIDSQIAEISDSLVLTENKLQKFRSSNQVMDLSFQGQKIYEQMNQLENDRAMILVQMKYSDYISEYFRTNDDVSDLLAPSAMDVNDPLLNKLINELIDLNTERLALLNNNTNPKNLFLNSLENQIQNKKQTIQENIKYSTQRSKITLNDINDRMSQLSSQISRLPKTEKELFGIERKFKLNDAIYTFLLQKRSESQIAKASNAPDYEIIDKALEVSSSKLSPKYKLTYIISLLLGLLIPILIILTKDLLNNKIQNYKDLKNHSKLPILGQVTHHSGKVEFVNTDNSWIITESLRTLRTNLKFVLKGKSNSVLLFTSSVSGEGKSFVALNTAMIYSQSGKKCLLMNFDLRKPNSYKTKGINTNIGISSYLIQDKSLDEIIQKTSQPNLDIVLAGPIPPNPIELIDSQNTIDLIEKLKKKYSYVIIDTPPVNLVADAMILMELTDVNLYVVRENYTTKEMLNYGLTSLVEKKFNHLGLILNDVRPKSNSYQYGYGYKYTAKKETFLQKMFAPYSRNGDQEKNKTIF